MSSELKQPLKDEIDEKLVVDYLRHHADFFQRHKDLLAELSLSHQSGAAVSLIERQVQVLREQRQQLKNRLAALIHNAQYNEELSQRLHELTLALLDVTGLEQLVAVLRERLLERFNADSVVIRLFGAVRPGGDGGAEPAGQDGQELPCCEEVFAVSEPLRGQLPRELLTELFGDGSDDIASAAVIPLGDKDYKLGVLALGSYDPERFHQRAGAMFLRSLGEILTGVMKLHLSHEAD